MKSLKELVRTSLKDFSFKKTIISCSLFFLSLFLAFPAGHYSNDVHIEACANYYADVAKNHTLINREKKLSGLLVEPKDGSKNKMRHDTDNAITELWGVFKGENASFAPVINVNRDIDIYFADKNFSSESLSIVYSNIGHSSEVYHTKNGVPVDYKFQSSPLALMFSSEHKGMHNSLIIYISQAQAERKLLAEGKAITRDNLKSLQGTKTEMEINGVMYNCLIDNIYLDNFKHSYKVSNYNYYYGTDVGTVIGDFVFVNFYAVYQDKIPPEESVKRQALYIMSEYSFRNKFFIEYAKESYSTNNYIFRFAKSNLKEGFVPNNQILEHAVFNSRSNVWCVLFTVLASALFILFIAFAYIKKVFLKPLSIFSLVFVAPVPYLIFKLIFMVTNNLALFSFYSLSIDLIFIIVFVIFAILINCIGRKKVVTEDYVK